MQLDLTPAKDIIEEPLQVSDQTQTIAPEGIAPEHEPVINPRSIKLFEEYDSGDEFIMRDFDKAILEPKLDWTGQVKAAYEETTLVGTTKSAYDNEYKVFSGQLKHIDAMRKQKGLPSIEDGFGGPFGYHDGIGDPISSPNFRRKIEALYRRDPTSVKKKYRDYFQAVDSYQLMTSDGISTKAEQDTNRRYFELQKEQALSGISGPLVGGMGGSLTDPLILATLPLGAPIAATGGTAVAIGGAAVRAAGQEAAVATLAEIPIQMKVYDYKKETDIPVTVGEAFISGVIGVGSAGILRGVGSAVVDVGTFHIMRQAAIDKTAPIDVEFTKEIKKTIAEYDADPIRQAYDISLVSSFRKLTFKDGKVDAMPLGLGPKLRNLFQERFPEGDFSKLDAEAVRTAIEKIQKIEKASEVIVKGAGDPHAQRRVDIDAVLVKLDKDTKLVVNEFRRAGKIVDDVEVRVRSKIRDDIKTKIKRSGIVLKPETEAHIKRTDPILYDDYTVYRAERPFLDTVAEHSNMQSDNRIVRTPEEVQNLVAQNDWDIEISKMPLQEVADILREIRQEVPITSPESKIPDRPVGELSQKPKKATKADEVIQKLDPDVKKTELELKPTKIEEEPTRIDVPKTKIDIDPLVSVRVADDMPTDQIMAVNDMVDARKYQLDATQRLQQAEKAKDGIEGSVKFDIARHEMITKSLIDGDMMIDVVNGGIKLKDGSFSLNAKEFEDYKIFLRQITDKKDC